MAAMNVQEILAEVTDHLRGMWRYRWVTVLVSWVVTVVGSYFVYTMPNIYEASARVSVDTNSLLPALTKGLTASENLMSEVDLVSKALLTRPNLEAVARETDLDLRAATPQQMELLITGLQQRVRVAGGRDRIFNISYTDANRDKAREVVSALLDTFMESSLGAQGDDADMTERALTLEIDDHEQRLTQAEEALADFKTRNLGYMPNDGGDYYTQLQTALSNVSETESQLRVIRQKREVIARQLEGEEPVFGLMPSTPALAMANCSQSANIAQMQAQLSELLVDFTEKHPRILMLQETLETLQAQCEAETSSMASMPSVVSPGLQSLDTNPVYQSLRLQMSEAEVELVELQSRYNQGQRKVARLRADVDKIAQVETELKRLNRDYGVVESRHQELLKRWETLQSKKRIDPVTDQVQFNILEPPFAAAAPVAPDRRLLLTGVLILALGAGMAIAFGLNQLKPVFFTRRSVTKIAGLPVLGTVSHITSPDEILARKRMTLIWAGTNVGLALFAILIIAAEKPVSLALRTLLGGAGV
jgi:polysaccharide chain length determinant protein (PEP-CTERM system associated)